MSYEQFNYASDKASAARVKITATVDLVVRDKDESSTGARYCVLPVRTAFAILDGAITIKSGSVKVSTVSTRVTIQTFGNASNQFEKYRVFVIEASAAVEILDLSGTKLKSIDQGQWIDINCDANGNMQSLSAKGTFTSTSLPTGSATLFSDMDAAFMEVDS